MPIFLFPRTPQQTDRYVKVLQLTPIDAPHPIANRSAQEKNEEAPHASSKRTHKKPLHTPSQNNAQNQSLLSTDPGNAPLSAFLDDKPQQTDEAFDAAQETPATDKAEEMQPRKQEESTTSTTAHQSCFSSVLAPFSHYSEQFEKTAQHPSEITYIPIEDIHPNPQQPRKRFGQAELQDLAESIKRYGILQPLIVRKVAQTQQHEPHFELIAGERRLHAARMACIYTVPCILLHATDEDSASIALIENLQRKNLDHFEQAQAIQALIQRYNFTQEALASRLGCSQSYIANKLRILRLTPEEQAKILQNQLTERHARALLQIADTALRAQLLDKIIENRWTVAEAEQQIRLALDKNGATAPAIPQKPHPEQRCFHTIDRAVCKFKQSGGNISCEKHESTKSVEWIIRVTK